jgi:cyanophycinase-like exopeptidase
VHFTVGGTSAGLDILGQYVNVAHFDSVTSPEALADPYNYKIELGTNFMFVDILKGIITDAHVYQEDRMGRICVFLGRLMKDYNLKSTLFLRPPPAFGSASLV